MVSTIWFDSRDHRTIQYCFNWQLLKPNKYQRTGRDHFERWKLKGRSHKQSRIVEETLQEAIEEESSVLSLSDLFENEIEKIGNFVRTLNYDTEGKAFVKNFQVLIDRLGPIISEGSARAPSVRH